MSGQHVGGVSDAIQGDEGGARAAMARLTKPTNRGAGRPTTGDGDPCPLVPEHGRMILVHGNERQWCPNQDHDGKWPVGEGMRTDPTQAFYPFPMPKEVARG